MFLRTGPTGHRSFDGHNRHGEHEWTTQGKDIEARPGRAFAFERSTMHFHYSTWGYLIEPTETGCRVTGWSEDFRPESTLELSKQISGVDDPTEPPDDERHARAPRRRTRELIPGRSTDPDGTCRGWLYLPR
jgi:hypothetical protein